MSAGQHDHHQKAANFAPSASAPGQPNWHSAIPKELHPAHHTQRFPINSNNLGFSSPSTPRKRTRSFTMETIPALPKVTGDIILEVFTHRSLRYPGAPANEEYGDNQRLSVLGVKALDAAVMYSLFCKRPMRNAEELQAEASDAVSDSNVDHWLTVYRLREKVRCTSDVVSDLKSPQEGRLLFTSYVGAVFAQSGMLVVQDWISKLIEPPPVHPTPSDMDPFSKRIKNEPAPIGIPPPPASSPAFALHQAHYNQPFVSKQMQPPPPPTNPPPPLPTGIAPNQPISFLPMFNQTANQRRLGVEYTAQFFGPPHAGRWTVKCMVNGIEKGQGMGSSKQLAKEEAAKQAWYSMGWV